jgi:FkbM family methyltransferase
MITPRYIVVRSLQRTGWALRRFGLKLGRLETPTSRAAGITFQWKQDPEGATRGIVVDPVIDGQRIWFFVNDNSDMIQRYHLQGIFYEADELALIASYYKGGLFVDVGANVGNHTLYLTRYLGAERVIAFEPYPPARRVLEINLALNGLSDRVTVHPVGLADAPGRASVELPFANIGGARFISSDSGAFEIVTGDSLIADEPVTFMKIDTEGLELKVLAGLRETIMRHRPVMFIEVEDVNIPAFEALCVELGYRTEKTFKRYAVNTNYLVLPAIAPISPI